MLRLRTLGTLDLRNANGDAVRAVLAQPKRAALLVYLAVAAPRGFHRRDQLLALFWPEHDADRARAALSRAIYFLRRELGEEVVVSRGDELGLDTTRLWCDANAFTSALDHERWQDAMELYRSDLLPGFFVSGARGFEEWVETERMRLRERASEAAWSLSDAEEAGGRLANAAHWAQRAAALSPFREIAVRRLLALLDRCGDRAAASEAYERFASEIADELELTPAPETQVLIENIRARRTENGAIESDTSRETSSSSVPQSLLDVPMQPAMPTSRRRMRWWSVALVASALAGLTLALVAWPRPIDTTRIVVEPFQNRTGIPAIDTLGRLAAERIVGRLHRSAVFTGAEVADEMMRRSVRFAPMSLVHWGDGFRFRRPVIVVSGQITRSRDSLVVQAWITDARRGNDPWAVAAARRPITSPDSAIESVEQRVVGGIAATRTAAAARFFPLASTPPRFDAFDAYAAGLELQSRGRTVDAMSHFRSAAMLDTSFTWPLVDGAMTGISRGAPSQTDSMIALLNAVRPRLVRLQRHLLDYLVAVSTSDWQGCYQALAEVAAVAPERYSYMYAISANHVNRPRKTIEVLSRRGLDTLYRNNTQSYWNVLTFAFHQVGDHRRELDAARRARSYQPGSAHALMQETRALVVLGGETVVRARLDTLLLLPYEGWFIPPHALMMVALELRAHSRIDEANAALHRAVSWFRARPAAEQASPLRRSQLAEALYLLGQFDEAETLYHGLAAGDSTADEYLAALGAIAARRGRRSDAETIAAKLEARTHFVPVPGSDATLGRAKIAALLGDRDRAMKLLNDAFGPWGTAAHLHTDIDFEGMRDDPRYREFVRPKG